MEQFEDDKTSSRPASFSYSRMSGSAFYYKVVDPLMERKILVAFVTVFVLLTVGFLLDFREMSRLSAVEGRHDSFYDYHDFYDYDGEMAETMVDSSVLAKDAQFCEALYCPVGVDRCFCVSKQRSTFSSAREECKSQFSGRLVQFRDSDEEMSFAEILWNNRGLEMTWIGLWKQPGGPVSWINCTGCLEPKESYFASTKTENITIPEDNCLISRTSVVQVSPCRSPEMSNWRKSVIDRVDRQGKDDPYWFEREEMEMQIGLNALCECNSIDQAKNIKTIQDIPAKQITPKKTLAMTASRFLTQDSAAKNCSSYDGCRLVTFSSSNEQAIVVNDYLFKGESFWIGATRTAHAGKSTSWTWSDGTSAYQPVTKDADLPVDTQCYSLGRTGSSHKHWMRVLHARPCNQLLPFACEVPIDRLKATTANKDHQISLRTVHQVQKVCRYFTCMDSTRCYCQLGRDNEWSMAHYTCQQENMTLAVLSPGEELNFFKYENNFKLFPSMWVGAHDFANKKQLTWVEEGSFANLGELIPDSNLQVGGCVQYGGYLPSNRRFSMLPCTAMINPLCEFNPVLYDKYLASILDGDYL